MSLLFGGLRTESRARGPEPHLEGQGVDPATLLARFAGGHGARLAARSLQGAQALDEHQCADDAQEDHVAEVHQQIDPLIDQVLRLLWDFTLNRLYPNNNPSATERMVLIAVGGYGRGEMAPHSDVDIVFLCERTDDERTVALIEAILYLLWDLGLTVGHSVRNVDDIVKMAKADGRVTRVERTFLDCWQTAG